MSTDITYTKPYIELNPRYAICVIYPTVLATSRTESALRVGSPLEDTES